MSSRSDRKAAAEADADAGFEGATAAAARLAAAAGVAAERKQKIEAGRITKCNCGKPVNHKGRCNG